MSNESEAGQSATALAALAEQIEQLGRLTAVLRNQMRTHRLVSYRKGGVDPADALETLRTIHRGVAIIEAAQLSAVAACRAIPEEIRPTWAVIGSAVDQQGANAHRRFAPAVGRFLEGASGGDSNG